MCHSNTRDRVKTGKLSSPSGSPVPCRQRLWRATHLFASHYLSVPWSIELVCSHRANTGLGTICCGRDLTCQQYSRNGEPVANETYQGGKVIVALAAIQNGWELQNNTSVAWISTTAEHGRRADNEG